MEITTATGTKLRVPDGSTTTDIIALLEAKGYDPVEIGLVSAEDKRLLQKAAAMKAAGGMRLGSALTKQAVTEEVQSRGPLEQFNLGGLPGMLDRARLRAKQALVELPPNEQMRLAIGEPVSATGPGLVGQAVGQSIIAGPLMRAAGAAATPALRLAEGALASGGTQLATSENPSFGGRVAETGVAGLLGGLPTAVFGRGVPSGPTAVRMEVADRARAAGLKINPLELPQGRTAANMAIALPGGYAGLPQAMSRANVEAVTKVTAKELGIAPTELTPAGLAHLKESSQRAYDVLRKGSFVPEQAFLSDLSTAAQKYSSPTGLASTQAPAALQVLDDARQLAGKTLKGTALVDELRALRAQASAGIGSSDPVRQAEGFAKKDVANALEGVAERTLGGEALKDFRASRKLLAQVYSVEAAMKAGGGANVSAMNLGIQLGAGEPLSGGLRIIAEAARNFPRNFQEGKAIADRGPVDLLSLYLAGGGVGLGTGMYTGRPLAGLAAGAALPAATWLSRSALTAGNRLAGAGPAAVTYGLIPAAAADIGGLVYGR